MGSNPIAPAKKMAKHVYISKLDAAKRQLETAIRLFFNNADMVSIHTLACTSHGLLRDLCNKQGLKSFIKDDYIDFIKKEKQAEFRKMITAPANFFKHADKDPQEAIKFYYETTPFFMWDSYRMYYQLTKEMPPMMKLFN
ncbi:MAG: hypothetical protein ISS88_03275, partial [Candidatus Portnoybacteria bacterium]|nr:hypothetical protein [Candidatus Portnoybacteria bacterium]